jgi:hypothetical protein
MVDVPVMVMTLPSPNVNSICAKMNEKGINIRNIEEIYFFIMNFFKKSDAKTRPKYKLK